MNNYPSSSGNTVSQWELAATGSHDPAAGTSRLAHRPRQSDGVSLLASTTTAHRRVRRSPTQQRSEHRVTGMESDMNATRIRGELWAVIHGSRVLAIVRATPAAFRQGVLA